MTPTNAFQYEMWFERALSLLNDWRQHKAGNPEVQEAYPLEYIGANLVEQVERIWRLNLPDKQTEKLHKNFLSCLEEWRASLVAESLKGAEVGPLSALVDNVVESIDFNLKVEDDPELDFDLEDEITDCLVKRDGLHLIMNFVERESKQLDESFKNEILTLLQDRFDEISQLDEKIKENIDVFALGSDFCMNYIKVNNIAGESLYWWLFEPISRVTDANIVSLLSLKPRFLKNTDDQQLKNLTTFLNVEVQKKKSKSTEDTEEGNTEQLDEKIVRLISTEGPTEPNRVGEEAYPYKLAASFDTKQGLEPGIYALVINIETHNVERHKVAGLVGSGQRATKYYAEDIEKIVNYLVPQVAEGKFQIKRRDFSIDLDKATQGCAGESLGLAALLEYLNKVGYLKLDTPVAATGKIELGGSVKKVSDINEKVKHAIDAGFQVVLIPEENKDELTEEFRSSKFIRFVSNVEQAKSSIDIHVTLNSDNTNKAINKLNAVRVLCRDEGFSVSDVKREQYNYNIEVNGLGDTVKAIIDFNSKEVYKPLRLQGKLNGLLINKLRELLSTARLLSEEASDVSLHLLGKARVLNETDKSKIQNFFKQGFADHLQPMTENGCDYRYDISKGGKVVIKQYKNGTLFLDGTSGELWNEIVNAIHSVAQIKVDPVEEKKTVSLSESLLPAGITTWIGVDEAGKGDYFGPLVTASVLVDPIIVQKLSQIGIRDSKALSDTRNIELGEKIRSVCGDKCYVLVTMPEKYNELMDEPSFKRDSQRILAWQHRRAIENILSKYECEYAICDQFGKEDLINEGLKTGKGTQIEIIQRPKAESNLAVAAASILARREFLLRLQKMSSDYGVNFPKGASEFENILQTAKTLMQKNGNEILRKVAKVHFKTTGKIMERLK